MTRVSAFKLVTRELCFVTLEGDKVSPELITHDVIPFPLSLDPPTFTDWAETKFGLLLDQVSPNQIIYKLSNGLQRNEQIFHIYYGLGILNLVAKKKNINIRHISPSSIRPKAFGLKKTDDVDMYIQSLFSNPGSPWNKNIREAVAIAILGMY